MEKPPLAILFDVDGVLTDGKVNVTGDGSKMFKSFHSRDVRAIRELVFQGHEVAFVTADGWGGTQEFAKKCRVECFVVKDKVKIADRFPRGFMYVGDDAFDVEIMKRAARLFVPVDADPSVLFLDGVRKLITPGGHGVVAELLRILYYS